MAGEKYEGPRDRVIVCKNKKCGREVMVRLPDEITTKKQVAEFSRTWHCSRCRKELNG